MSDCLTIASQWFLEHLPGREAALISSGAKTAEILQTLGSDDESIVAGMLHCYSPFTEEEFELAKLKFGTGTMMLMERVNKMSELSGLLTVDGQTDHSETNEENLRRMLLTMIDDVRVVLIKLSNHLQTLREAKHRPRVTPQASRKSESPAGRQRRKNR